ncbi:RDD family protein [Rubripirellula tenax]|uniref:RDD family protein n=1 Tax=Rubripirellula tenax TaxID=2528015 RepID=A0A5C6FBN8_9BACT|nr:RDD family protein [Rubripirellula tenax]TWU59173.1 RDD family protein [Rubripirellula tenax]
MAASQALDTTIAVVTPENIAFDYQLAGPFRRLPAYLIDLAVRWVLIVIVVLGIYLVGGLIDFQLLGPFATAAGFLVYFGISWFYGTVMETVFNGRTIGKWSVGIRAIDTEGRPINAKRAFLRNLLRIADLAPVAALTSFSDEVPPVFIIPTGMIGLATMLLTRRLQRLGDLAAGTMVIVDERAWRLPIAKVDDPRVAALASFFPGDYRVSRSMARTLAVYAERRHYLTPARRREVARHLTVPLIERFEFRADIDPDLLMYALYYKTFLSESSAEPPDLGPFAGYSPLLRDAGKPAPADSTSTLHPTAPEVFQ